MDERSSTDCARPDGPGLRLTEDGAVFGVASRHAEHISVCLFDDADTELARIALAQRDGDLHFGFLPGVREGQRYGLRADGPWAPGAGHRFDPAKLLVDPLARRLDRPFLFDAALTLGRDNAVDTARLVPKAIAADALAPLEPSPVSTPGLIYELGVKAHTMRDERVPAELRGTLGALACPHVIDRLVRLGVTHVELLPIAAWIATSNGVILDVVYNHTGESDQFGPILSMRGLDNALYYRHAADGSLINDAGCGNSLDGTQPVVVALIVEALRRCVLEAGVEGFRFDLATSLARRPEGFDLNAPLLAAISTDSVLRDRLLIAEPWDIGPGGYQLGRFPRGWLEWNDRYRDDVRRFWRGNFHAAGDLATRLAGSADIFERVGRSPRESINFIAAHDGFTLRDLVSHSAKSNLANGEHNRDGNDAEICWNNGIEGETGDAAVIERRKADVRALLATLFLSLGTPMLTAGDEFGRTQDGNNNAYAQDNATTWADWAKADDTLAAFVAGLVRLRAQNPALTDNVFLTGRAAGDATCPDVVGLRAEATPMRDDDWGRADFIAMTRAGQSGGRLHLAFNRSHEDVEMLAPQTSQGMQWVLALDSASAFVGVRESADGRFTVAARSVVALVETALP